MRTILAAAVLTLVGCGADAARLGAPDLHVHPESIVNCWPDTGYGSPDPDARAWFGPVAEFGNGYEEIVFPSHTFVSGGVSYYDDYLSTPINRWYRVYNDPSTREAYCYDELGASGWNDGACRGFNGAMYILGDANNGGPQLWVDVNNYTTALRECWVMLEPGPFWQQTACSFYDLTHSLPGVHVIDRPDLVLHLCA